MRHLRKGNKLSLVSRKRKALMKALATALVEQGRIKTTLPRAKNLRPIMEKVLTKAKKNNFLAIRALRKDFCEKTVQDLIKKWAPLFQERSGGYTRIIKLKNRISDASPMAYIEFIEKIVEKKDKIASKEIDRDPSAPKKKNAPKKKKEEE